MAQAPSSDAARKPAPRVSLTHSHARTPTRLAKATGRNVRPNWRVPPFQEPGSGASLAKPGIAYDRQLDRRTCFRQSFSQSAGFHWTQIPKGLGHVTRPPQGACSICFRTGPRSPSVSLFMLSTHRKMMIMSWITGQARRINPSPTVPRISNRPRRRQRIPVETTRVICYWAKE